MNESFGLNDSVIAKYLLAITVPGFDQFLPEAPTIQTDLAENKYESLYNGLLVLNGYISFQLNQ